MTFEQAELLLNHRYDKVDSDAYSITGGIYTKVPGASLLRKKMYLDFRLWMPYDILNKADKMTMANSLFFQQRNTALPFCPPEVP